MFASNLERVLTNLSRKSDASPGTPADMQRRFETLRSYGCLPQGREHRATRLANVQIAQAVLGLTPTDPGWAGHSAIVLGGLLPVGGPSASLMGARSLAEAVGLLCSSEEARRDLIGVTLTMAEVGVNSSGFGVISLRNGEAIRYVGFVSPLATSLLHPGAEKGFDPAGRLGRISRQLMLDKGFFDRLAQEIEDSLHWPEPAGDGSEYDSDDARRARLRALGIVNASRFLNIGVDTQVTWPKEETLVEFDRYKLVLMPKTGKHTQSVHVDLFANRLTDTEALTVVNRFLSVMTWCDDRFAISEGGWSGNPIPVAVDKRDLGPMTASPWMFYRSFPATDEARRALAHYREARNAEEASLVSYAVLSYFKIIELRHKEGLDVQNWIAANLGAALPADPNDHIHRRFMDALGNDAPEAYLWKACRIAVAHASVKRPSDADDAEEVRRLHVAAEVMRRLARQLIVREIGVSESRFSDA